MGTCGSFSGGKAAGEWKWQLTSSSAGVGQECWSYISTPRLHGCA
jgi:hypothetical protein